MYNGSAFSRPVAVHADACRARRSSKSPADGRLPLSVPVPLLPAGDKGSPGPERDPTGGNWTTGRMCGATDVAVAGGRRAVGCIPCGETRQTIPIRLRRRKFPAAS